MFPMITRKTTENVICYCKSYSLRTVEQETTNRFQSGTPNKYQHLLVQFPMDLKKSTEGEHVRHQHFFNQNISRKYQPHRKGKE